MTNKITLQGQLKRVEQKETKTDKKSVSAIVFSIKENGHWVDLGYELHRRHRPRHSAGGSGQCRGQAQ